MFENPILQTFGDQRKFFRSTIRYKSDGRKEVPYRPPITTAENAISLHKPEPWDKPHTHNPLIFLRGNFFLIDGDGCIKNGKVHPVILELQERLGGYWDYSWSGKGVHGYFPTNLRYIGRGKHLVAPLGFLPEDGKVEMFTNQNSIVTNNHALLKPLKNMDEEILQAIKDLLLPLIKLYKQIYKNSKITDKTKDSRLGSHKIRWEHFTGYLMEHECERGYPGKTKRWLLERIWDIEPYQYQNEKRDDITWWKPFYETGVAKELGILPRNVSKHLHELKANGWLDIYYSKYSSGRTAMSVRLR